MRSSKKSRALSSKERPVLARQKYPVGVKNGEGIDNSRGKLSSRTAAAETKQTGLAGRLNRGVVKHEERRLVPTHRAKRTGTFAGTPMPGRRGDKDTLIEIERRSKIRERRTTGPSTTEATVEDSKLRPSQALMAQKRSTGSALESRTQRTIKRSMIRTQQPRVAQNGTNRTPSKSGTRIIDQKGLSRTSQSLVPQRPPAGVQSKLGLKAMREKSSTQGTQSPAVRKGTSGGALRAGFKRKSEIHDNHVNQPKKAQKQEPPKKVACETFFDRMRRSRQGLKPDQRSSATAVGKKRQIRSGDPARTSTVPDEMADFIDDDEDDQNGMNWKEELRRTTRYDPAKFKNELYDDDDRMMESSLRQCWKEERRSQHIGRLEDQRELARELKRKGVRNN